MAMVDGMAGAVMWAVATFQVAHQVADGTEACCTNETQTTGSTIGRNVPTSTNVAPLRVTTVSHTANTTNGL
jgi:hypothetical protein